MLDEDRTCPRPLAWMCSAKTDRGSVRKVNEDAWLSRPELGVWAVADGMGGHQVGDLASRMVIDALDAVQGELCLSSMVESVEAKVTAGQSGHLYLLPDDVFILSHNGLDGR